MSLMQSDYLSKYEAITDTILTLAGSDQILYIYPHISADGDALGSSLGLALILAKLDVKARILTSEELSEKLAFLPHHGLINCFDRSKEQEEEILRSQAMALAIDCSAADRLAKRLPLYEAAKTKLVIDHHISDLPDEPLYLVNTTAAATCEMIVFYMRYLEERFSMELLDSEIGVCLMTGMVTDTGRFSFSSVTARTFEAASVLMRIPIAIGELTEHLFDTISVSKLRLTGIIANRAELYHDDLFVIADLPKSILDDIDWVETDLEGLAAKMRNVDSVELSVMLRELKNGYIRGNIRSGPLVDAQAFARQFGGGGHLRAAGFTVKDMTMADAKVKIIQLAGEVLSTIKPSEA